MPDKHVGRLRLYEAVRISIYRKTWKAPASTFKLMGVVGPYYIKNRAEIPGICRQIANANKTMGFYDWGFKHEILGVVTRKTVENSDWQTKENLKKLGHA